MSNDSSREASSEAVADERWFVLSYGDRGINKGICQVTAFMDAALGAGPGVAGVGVGPAGLRIRAGEFRLEIPRSRITGAHHFRGDLRGITGIHHRGRRWIVNGGPEGVVEVLVSPAVYTRQQLSSLFRRLPVASVRVSLDDPGGFLVALGFPG